MYPTITITMEDENHNTVYEHITNFIETMPSVTENMITAWNQYKDQIEEYKREEDTATVIDTCTEAGMINMSDLVENKESIIL